MQKTQFWIFNFSSFTFLILHSLTKLISESTRPESLFESHSTAFIYGNPSTYIVGAIF